VGSISLLVVGGAIDCHRRSTQLCSSPAERRKDLDDGIVLLLDLLPHYKIPFSHLCQRRHDAVMVVVLHISTRHGRGYIVHHIHQVVDARGSTVRRRCLDNEHELYARGGIKQKQLHGSL
jgi:hypothetical protein